MTLMRFAQLTARLDGCVSRDALLEQEGLTLEDWLRGQKYWLEELTNHTSANRPLLFKHYLALLDQERQLLGKPPLAGKATVQTAARKLYDLTAPQPDPADATFPERSLEPGSGKDPLTFGSSEVPDFLRSQAESTPSPPVQAASVIPPAPAYVPAAYQPPDPDPLPPPDVPDFLRVAASMPAVPPPIPYEPQQPPPSPPESAPFSSQPPYSEIPAFLRGAPTAIPSQPANQPRLRLEDYVELVFSAEQAASPLQTQLLQRFGFDEHGWLEESRRWQQQFITYSESRQRFEQLMLARRGYGPSRSPR